MTHPPIPALKLPLLLVLAALLLAIASTLWSQGLAQDAAMAMQQQHNTLNSSRQQLDRSRQQQQLFTAHLADYQALTARGFVGKEDRLAWIEAAQHANRDVQLYGLNYRLTPRTLAPSPLAHGLPLGQTAMSLSLPLLVETDLPRFLDALKVRAPGVVRVQACSVSRLDAARFEAVNRPHLQAECELLWFTVLPDRAARSSGTGS